MKDGEDGKHHLHHWTLQYVTFCQIAAKCPSSSPIISQEVAASSREANHSHVESHQQNEEGVVKLTTPNIRQLS